MSRTVPVGLGARAYDVLIGPGLVTETGRLIATRLGPAKCAIVTDENVARRHLVTLETALKAYYRYRSERPTLVREPYLYFVDLGLDARTPRGWVFDMESLTVVDGLPGPSEGVASAEIISWQYGEALALLAGDSLIAFTLP